MINSCEQLVNIGSGDQACYCSRKLLELMENKETKFSDWLSVDNPNSVIEYDTGLPPWLLRQCEPPGPCFNLKMSSYQHRKSHCGEKTVVRSSDLHNGISYAVKILNMLPANEKQWTLPTDANYKWKFHQPGDFDRRCMLAQDVYIYLSCIGMDFLSFFF